MPTKVVLGNEKMARVALNQQNLRLLVGRRHGQRCSFADDGVVRSVS